MKQPRPLNFKMKRATSTPNTRLDLRRLSDLGIGRITVQVVKKHVPEMVELVHFDTLAPHLFAKEMLTTEELVELLDKKKAVVARVARLLAILKTKGSKWPQNFAESLRCASEHTGHEHLLRMLTSASMKIGHISKVRKFDDDGVLLPTTPKLTHSRRHSTTGGGGGPTTESVFNYTSPQAAIMESNEVASQDPPHPAEVVQVISSHCTGCQKICCCPKNKKLKERNQDLEEKIQELEKEIETLNQRLEATQTAEKAFEKETETYKERFQQSTKNMKFEWQTPLPEKIAGGSLRAHLNIKQNKVYVCGGDITKSTPNNCVYVFCLTRQKWINNRNSITTPAIFFGSAMIKDNLVIIGGCDSNNRRGYTRSLKTLIEKEDNTTEWKEEWKEMPSERRTILAMSNDSYLVVAGGYDPEDQPLNLVEILNCDTNQWQEKNEALYLPIPLAAASGVFCDGYFYVLGGVSSADHHSPEPEDWINKAYRCHEGDLMGSHHNTPDNGASSSSSTTSSPWKCIADMRLNGIAAVAFFDKVFTFGGKSQSKVSGEVYVYDSDKDKWSYFGAKMPISRYNSSAVVLPKCQIMVVGGRKSTEEEASTNVVETATLCDSARSN